MRLRHLLAAVILLLLVTAGRTEEPKPLPPELRWIPADSFAFVHVRLAELWDSKAGKAVAAFVAGADSRMLADWERNFGVAMAQVDRLTVVIPDAEAGARGLGIVVRITTREPYDRAQLVAAMGLQGRPDRPKVLGGGKTLFVRGYGGEYVHLTDARTITVFSSDGAAGLLSRMLDGETSGRLSPAIEAAAKGDHVVAAIDATRLRDLPPDFLGDEFRPLLEAGFAMVRGKLTEDGADLDFRATFQKEDHAKAGRLTLLRLQEELVRDLDRSLRRLGTTEENATDRLLLEALVGAAKSARFEVDGGHVTGKASITSGPFVAFMNKDGGKSAKAAGERRVSSNNLKQIALAMHNYESAYGRLPTQAILAPDGKPLLSWRVAILPFIEEDQLYREFRLNEPWDSEHNKKLIPRLPKIYQVPGRKFNAEGKTAYLAPVGPGTIFPAAARTGSTLAKITSADGCANTIMTVQSADSAAVIWTKPDDLTIDAQDPLRGLKRSPPEAFLVVMADGSTKLVPARVNPKQMLAGFNWRDGAIPNFEDLLPEGK